MNLIKTADRRSRISEFVKSEDISLQNKRICEE
jgi:hypothetical protein